MLTDRACVAHHIKADNWTGTTYPISGETIQDEIRPKPCSDSDLTGSSSGVWRDPTPTPTTTPTPTPEPTPTPVPATATPAPTAESDPPPEEFAIYEDMEVGVRLSYPESWTATKQDSSFVWVRIEDEQSDSRLSMFTLFHDIGTPLSDRLADAVSQFTEEEIAEGLEPEVEQLGAVTLADGSKAERADITHPEQDGEGTILHRLLHSETHDSRYSNPEFDDLVEAARVEANVDVRLGLYRQAEQLLMDDAGIIPLFHVRDYVLVRPQVEGFRVLPLGQPDLTSIKLNPFEQ